MKRRHPMQILDAAELVAGEVYALVLAYSDSRTNLYEQRCLAVVADTERLLLERGRWRGVQGDDEYTLDDLMDAESAINATETVQTVMGPTRLTDRIDSFTVHLDGWTPYKRRTRTILVDWCGWRRQYEADTAYAFNKNDPEQHTVIVPVTAWMADPHIHVLDWVNPDDVVEPLMPIAPALGDDAAADKRRDDNLRRIFG